MRASRLLAFVFALALSMAASHADAAIALVAHTSAQSTGGAGAAVTTSAIDTTGSTLLVVSVSWYLDGGGTLAVSDSKGNTWVQITSAIFDPGSARTQTVLFYVKNPTVGTGHTFTCGGAGTYCGIFVATFSGTDTAQNVDQHNQAGSGPGTSTTFQPGSVTPSQNNELIVSGLLQPSNTSQTLSIDSGFSKTDEAPLVSGNAFGGALAYFVQGTAAAINPTWTASPAAGLAATSATFKAAGGAAAPIRHRATTN